ncbi:hypothetical protein D3C76_1638900 [compost metagenome]
MAMPSAPNSLNVSKSELNGSRVRSAFMKVMRVVRTPNSVVLVTPQKFLVSALPAPSG